MLESAKQNVSKLEEILQVEFSDINILLSAMTHRSYLNEHRDATHEHNERLEFLGDAVLELVVTDFLFRTYTDKPEGELTAIRAALVNTNALSTASERLAVSDYILMSKGEAKDHGRARQYILANVFEAFVGAIYLDQGYESSRKFITRELLHNTEQIVRNRLWQDPKSRFQELAQERASITPTYQLVEQSGPDHDRVFTIGVYLKDEQIATGQGRSKQEAEQQAAEAGLAVKDWNIVEGK